MLSLSSVLLLAAMAAIALSFIMIFSPFLPHNPQERLPNNIEELTPESGFASGYFPHYLNASFPNETYEVKRGSTISIPITITHQSHAWWQGALVGDFRLDASYKSQPNTEVAGIGGHFSPSTLVVWSNSSAQTMLTMSVPETLPDEVISKTVDLRIVFYSDFPLTGATGQAGWLIPIYVLLPEYPLQGAKIDWTKAQKHLSSKRIMGWRSSILIVALVFGILFSALYVSALSALQRRPDVIPTEPKISQLKAIEITEQNLQKEIPNLDGAWLYFYQYNFSLTRFHAGSSDPEYADFILSVNRNGGWSFSHVKEHPELLQLPLYFVNANGTQYEITNGTYKMRCIKAPDISRCPLFLPAAEAAKGRLVYRIESRWHPASAILPIGEGYHIIDAETGKLVWNSIDFEKSRSLIPKGVHLYDNSTNPPKTIKQLDEEKQQLIQKALNPPEVLKIRIAEGAANQKQPTNFIPKNARCLIGICNKVEWTNNDTVAHTVRSDNNYTNPYTGKFFSDLIKPNERYEYTFVEVGEYRYHCDIHPWMKGIVEMVENLA